MKQKLNKTKLIKGIIFLAIAIVFAMVTFYKITQPTGNTGFGFYEIYRPTKMNYIFTALFALLGILEIKEAINNGN